MGKYIVGALTSLVLLFSGCNKNGSDKTITFALSADYPPFEYYKDNKITGFDVELAEMLAKEMGKKAKFENMQFSGILAALQNGSVDAAISTIAINEERQINFDFSDPYYTESLAAVFKKDTPITDSSMLTGKNIACQLGTTMEMWLKKHTPTSNMLLMDSNNQVIEALKAGHVDVALVDGVQAMAFCQQNAMLGYTIIAQSDSGYGVAFKKGSPLQYAFNKALKSLAAKGELEKLEQKWLKGKTWKN
jgi:polar amino acid transport system substrate-binding protein